MGRRAIYVALGLILLAAVGGLVAWRADLLPRREEAPLRAATVESGPMVVAVTAAGRIQPAARVGLAFETPGRIAEVWAEEGQRVRAGDPLASVVADDLQLQVEQSKAALASAEAQLAQLQAGPGPKELDQARANLRTAEAQLRAAEARYRQLAAGPNKAEVAAAEAQLAQATTNMEIAQDSYDAIEEEGTRKEQANYDLYTAKQEVAAAQARLQDIRAGASGDELRSAKANVASATAQRDAAQAQLEQLRAGATDEELAEAEAQVSQARVALALAEHNLGRATLRSPFDGLVVEVNVVPGELPPTQEQALILLDDSAFHITVAVDELDVSQLRPGQKAEVEVEALPGADVNGRVVSISPVSAVGAGVVAYDVLIELGDTEAPLRADMTANATIVVEELTDVLQIPTWLLRIDRETGQTYVHRQAEGEVERVDVELGVREEGVAQVLSGLSAGDEVVRLDDGASVGFEVGQRFRDR